MWDRDALSGIFPYIHADSGRNLFPFNRLYKPEIYTGSPIGRKNVFVFFSHNFCGIIVRYNRQPVDEAWSLGLLCDSFKCLGADMPHFQFNMVFIVCSGNITGQLSESFIKRE